MPKTQLKLTSGQVIEIPPRLLAKLENESAWKYSLVRQSHADVKWDNDSSLHTIKTASAALQSAGKAAQQEIGDEAVMYLSLYSELEAQTLANNGQTAEAFQLLAETIRLAHQTLADFQPRLTSSLIQHLVQQTEDAIYLSTTVGSLTTLGQLVDDLSDVLTVAATVWDPAVEVWLREFIKFLPVIAEINIETGVQQRRHISELMKTLFQLKKRLHANADSSSPTIRQQLQILQELIESWLQIVQQELLLAASAEYSAAGLDSESIKQQVQQLLAEVERRLRLSIIHRYQKQFGTGWIHHIKSRHKVMYERWQNDQERDSSAFKVYGQNEIGSLTYSGFNDLRELITAQWHLFNDIFDFGYHNRNKSVFNDKITLLIKVRNPLAHHRDVPENELLRAKVLCTDLLLALDRAGEGLEPQP